MEMGMKKQVLSPTVQYGEEADLGAQMFGIGRDGRQRLGRSSEQDAVDQILVLVSEGSDVFGQCKNHVEVLAVQDFGFSFFDPLCTSERLTLGAMTIAAAIVARPFVGTAVAVFEMTAEGCRATHLDRGHDAPLRRGERRTVLLTISFSIAAEDCLLYTSRCV